MTRAPAMPLASAQALELTGRGYLSHSQLTTFQSCPKKFDFQYVQQIPRDFLSASLVMGTSIHSAIQAHFAAYLAGENSDVKSLEQVYIGAWGSQVLESPELPLRFAKGESQESLQDKVARMLEAFLESPVSRPQGQIIGIEEQLELKLCEDLPTLLGRLDLLWLDDREIHVVDVKTSRAQWNGQQLGAAAEQLVLYRELIAKLAGQLELPVTAQFVILTKHKTPRVQVLSAQLAEDNRRQLSGRLSEIWQAMQARHFYPTPSAMTCSSCPFQSHCPIFGGR